MKKSIQNAGAKEVRRMIKKGDGLRSIMAFAKGYGFDVESPSSAVYVNSSKEVCTRVGHSINYDRVPLGF